MSGDNGNHALPQLSEKEAAQLARAVQILIHDLGFDREDVDRSYAESLAYFLKHDHVEQRLSDSRDIVHMSSIV